MAHAPGPGQEILRRSNAGQLAKFPVEVRLVGIARFQRNVDPSEFCSVYAMPERFLKSSKPRVDVRRSAYSFAEKLNEVPMAVTRLLNDRCDIRAGGKAIQGTCHRRMISRGTGKTATKKNLQNLKPVIQFARFLKTLG